MRIKRDPSLQDKSPAQFQHRVSTNALTALLQRGGDVYDRREVMKKTTNFSPGRKAVYWHPDEPQWLEMRP
ncbi:hypothetical protein EYF80_064055 [Liparis tanakae]|uniref:Uncharacterized protein n=1 Tax=Liparis tanakae TaxID=230148 RepID=A0A4Z2EAR7_9TELE|nr:hypothetical protein EYF80_064055 [Liparis tanakae]